MIKRKAVRLIAASILSMIGAGVVHASVADSQVGPGTRNLNLNEPPRVVTTRIVVNSIGGAVDIDTANGNFSSTGYLYCQNGNHSGLQKNGTSAVHDGDITLLCDFLVPALQMDGTLSKR
jgi:hypothetical protein